VVVINLSPGTIRSHTIVTTTGVEIWEDVIREILPLAVKQLISVDILPDLGAVFACLCVEAAETLVKMVLCRVPTA